MRSANFKGSIFRAISNLIAGLVKNRATRGETLTMLPDTTPSNKRTVSDLVLKEFLTRGETKIARSRGEQKEKIKLEVDED